MVMHCLNQKNINKFTKFKGTQKIPFGLRILQNIFPKSWGIIKILFVRRAFVIRSGNGIRTLPQMPFLPSFSLSYW